MERWEFEEKVRRCVWYVGLIAAGTLLLFGLLWFIASHSHGRSYDPFAETCGRMREEARAGGTP